MRRSKLSVVALIAGLTSLAASAAATAPVDGAAPLFGFRAAEINAQLSLEQRFDGALQAADLRAWLKTMAAGANHVGAPHNKANAEFVRDLFRQWGFKSEIETYSVLYPTLKQHALELITPVRFKARLHEPPVPGDATSARTDGMAPYNSYGADGDVTGELVYVNFGTEDDYKLLARTGVSVKGRIVITRYGGVWRGLKPKLAAEHGAIGCIIYSDPKDDGYGRGDPYPKGGWRNADGVQRGSVLDIVTYTGDPLTPGVGATPEAKRLSLAEAKTLMKIPVLPISWGEALPLLRALEGPVAPQDWRGGLALTYHLGSGPARVRLMVKSDWRQQPLYDVIATVPGSERPDEWVVRGNHRDGWVYGAWDPLSGHIAMMAEAKAIGALLKSGWRPKRTLVYASWDGEEPGLLGSTEWAEAHAAELQQKAVLYLNSDLNSRGFLDAGGSHTLQHLVNDVARTINDPQMGVSVLTRLRADIEVTAQERGGSDELKQEAKLASDGGDFTLNALGTGSDYTPFLQHLGITALDIQYSGEEDQGGVYHSAYDTFEHYARFGDPTFAYGVAEAQTAGHLILRMANAEVLPLQFTGFADYLDHKATELRRMTDSKRSSATTLTRLLDAKSFALATDPTRPVAPPEREAEVPALGFGVLDDAVLAVRSAARAYDAAYERWLSGKASLSDAQLRQLNALLRGMEQQLLAPEGLPGRAWYKHAVYAPGMLTGYGVKVLPMIREPIDVSHWDAVASGVPATARLLQNYAVRLREAATLLESNAVREAASKP